jgi:hypothetical protein
LSSEALVTVGDHATTVVEGREHAGAVYAISSWIEGKALIVVGANGGHHLTLGVVLIVHLAEVRVVAGDHAVTRSLASCAYCRHICSAPLGEACVTTCAVKPTGVSVRCSRRPGSSRICD